MMSSVLLLAILALPSGAQEQPAPSTASVPVTTAAAVKAQPNDPSQLICETVEGLGTRLTQHKVCMTRAEWRAQRQADRMAIERGQQMGIRR
jgi:hypothetical protein